MRELAMHEVADLLVYICDRFDNVSVLAEKVELHRQDFGVSWSRASGIDT